jgi:F420-dependent oxidoreductase-like protein
VRAEASVKLGLATGSAQRSGAETAALAVRAEELGYDSIWTSEAWGADAFTPLAYMAAVTSRIKLGTAIAQLAARTPAATAMTALTLQELSGHRLLLGLGVSGPQVVEGWHGVSFGKPLAKTRDYLQILRKMMAGDERVEFEGPEYQVPYRGPGSTGLGKPLRTTFRDPIAPPILLAAIGPKNVALAVEHADGLLPYLWSPTRWDRAWREQLTSSAEGFGIAPTVVASINDDLAEARAAVRPHIALHVGGMGARGQNFYHALVTRYGYEEEADRIQDLYLAGDRDGAIDAVSDEMVDDLALVGPPARVRDQLDLWRGGPVTTLLADPTDDRTLEELAAIWRDAGMEGEDAG